MTEADRTDPPLAADEATTLLAFLDFHRDTVRWKASGLDGEQFSRSLAPSDMTLGGMVKHLACVEDYWLGEILLGRAASPPFDSAPWDEDRDWDWHSAAHDSPDYLLGLLDEAIERSRRATSDLLDTGGLDGLSAGRSRSGEQFSLRWVLVQ